MDVLIVGNGISRLAFTDQIKTYKGEIWACNNAYKEFGPYLKRLTGHVDVLYEAEKYRNEHNLSFEIWSGNLGKPDINWRKFIVPAKWYRDSGTTLIAEALFERYDNIELVGFDLGGADVYALDQYKVDKTSWVKRFVDIEKEWSLKSIKWWGYNHTPFIQKCVKNPGFAHMYYKAYGEGDPHIKDMSYINLFKSMVNSTPNTDKLCNYRVKFPNGYIGVIKADIAKRLIERHQVEFVEEILMEG